MNSTRGPKTRTSPSRRHDSQREGQAGGCASPSATAGDGGAGPDEPDEGEFGLIGDNDLGAADLGPAAPGAHDPDAGSGRMRKITPDGGRDTGRG